jgi:ATP-dependent Lon protease
MEVFVFPLVNVSLFPQTTKPLNIFEPRYLAMVRDSIATNTPIAIGFIDQAQKVGHVFPGEHIPFLREIAGFGLATIIEERINGTLLIFLHGRGKVKLGKVLDKHKPYLVCEAEVLTEETEVIEENQTQLKRLRLVLERWIQRHLPDPVQREIFMRNLTGPAEIVGNFSSYLVRDFDLQQMVLELSDINAKIKLLTRLIESNELSF